VNGDGFADIAVVARGVYNVPDGTATLRPSTNRRVELFFGGATVDAQADEGMGLGTSDGYARGFAATDLDGDTLPDLAFGRWITNYQGRGEVAIYRGSAGFAAPALVLTGAAAGDAFGAKIGREVATATRRSPRSSHPARRAARSRPRGDSATSTTSAASRGCSFR
jgi:hypothetical protein